ncbi:MAG TPA: glycosyltransferase family 4 protein, partial [Clostridiales bacterium]|nr:glycosyltransferase family 4 protein [Clostridiales bacterium]
RFNIVGDGRFKDTLINIVSEYEVTEFFNFIPKQSPTRIPEFMSVCDATLISLSKSKVFSITLPAKTQSCLACGIPIIVSADGEIQEVIEKAEAGVCSDAGDVCMLAEKISELISKPKEELNVMGKNAYNYSRLMFDKQKLLARMDECFKGNYDKKYRGIGAEGYVQK